MSRHSIKISKKLQAISKNVQAFIIAPQLMPSLSLKILEMHRVCLRIFASKPTSFGHYAKYLEFLEIA